MYTTDVSQASPYLPFIAILALLIGAFELWMLISVIVNKGISNKARTWWIIGMILIHPIVAIVYVCTDYRKRNTSVK